jgi:uncharacterized membrane protein
MRLELVAVPVAANVLSAVALTLTPMWVHPGTYFGVRVPPEYRSTLQARQSRRKFALEVWLATAISVGLSSIGQGKPSLIFLGLLIQLAATVLAFRSGWQTTKAHGIEPSSTRTAHLLAPRPRLPGGPAAVATPFLLLAAVAAYVKSKFDSIPLRFPIHFDVQGHPNGWADRSVKAVFGPLLGAFALMMLFLGLALLQQHAVRRAPEGSGLARRNRANLAALVIVMWMVAVIFSLVALTPVVTRNGNGALPIPAFVILLIPLTGVIAIIWLVARANAEPDDTPTDVTPDECWKWGQIYYNPSDPAIMVEKRFGMGYTPNFARWQSWVVLGGMLAVIAGTILLRYW